MKIINQVPPQPIEILTGVFIESSFKPEHDLAPSRKDQQLITTHPRGGLIVLLEILDLHSHGFEPISALGKPFEHHRYAFGRQDMGFATQ